MFSLGEGTIKAVIMNIKNMHWVLVDFRGYNEQAEQAFTNSIIWALAYMHQPPTQEQQVRRDAAWAAGELQCCMSSRVAWPAGEPVALHGQQGSCHAACCPLGSAPSCTSGPQMGSRGLPHAVWGRSLMGAACPATGGWEWGLVSCRAACHLMHAALTVSAGMHWATSAVH